MLSSASLLVAYSKHEKMLEAELRKVPASDRKKGKTGAGTTAPAIAPIPIWEDDGTHPSALLTTSDKGAGKPRL